MMKGSSLKVQQVGLIESLSPVDLEVTDPQGNTISKFSTGITGALYEEIDPGGEVHDVVTIPFGLPGNYRIEVVPEEDAFATDTYTLEVTQGGEITILAQDQMIQDIPSEPFVVSVAVPFDSFDVEKAKVKLKRGAARDRFKVQGRFVLGAASDGIDVLNEDVSVTFDGLTATIPAGSLSLDYDEGFEFKGAAGGVKVEIRDDGRFKVQARGLNLSGLDLATPVPFVIQIGNDRGETAIPFDEKGKFKAKKK